MKKVLLINKKDNVVTALSDIKPGDLISVEMDESNKEIEVNDKVLFGHKINIKNIKKGDQIIKYGEVIGKATENIKIGSHVHIHNVESLRGRGDLSKD